MSNRNGGCGGGSSSGSGIQAHAQNTDVVASVAGIASGPAGHGQMQWRGSARPICIEDGVHIGAVLNQRADQRLIAAVRGLMERALRRSGCSVRNTAPAHATATPGAANRKGTTTADGSPLQVSG